MMYRLFKFGFPCCHECCARNYFVVLWDVGEALESVVKLGLN